MRPFIIGVGGARSGAGKTSVIEGILKRLSGMGAIKCTKTRLYTSITDDPAVLGQSGKDTARLIGAGAEEVLWVRSPDGGVKEALEAAVERLSHLRGVVVEGNSAIEALRPDIVIFVAGEKAGETKQSGRAVLSRADVVVHSGRPPDGLRPEQRVFERRDVEGFSSFIEKLMERQSSEAQYMAPEGRGR